MSAFDPRARAALSSAVNKMERHLKTLPARDRSVISARLRYVFDPHDKIAIGWSLIRAAEKRRDQTPAQKDAEEAARRARVAAYLERAG